MENQNLVESVLVGDSEQAFDSFNSIIAEKLADALEVRKVQIASEIMAEESKEELPEPNYSDFDWKTRQFKSKKDKKGKVEEEVEQIDELSKDLLRRYGSRALRGHLTAKNTSSKRARGVNLASAKVYPNQYKNSPDKAKVPATNEEVEQIDELKASTVKSYLDKVYSDKMSDRDARITARMQASGTKKPNMGPVALGKVGQGPSFMRKKVKVPATNEEVEQLAEESPTAKIHWYSMDNLKQHHLDELDRLTPGPDGPGHHLHYGEDHAHLGLDMSHIGTSADQPNHKAVKALLDKHAEKVSTAKMIHKEEVEQIDEQMTDDEAKTTAAELRKVHNDGNFQAKNGKIYHSYLKPKRLKKVINALRNHTDKGKAMLWRAGERDNKRYRRIGMMDEAQLSDAQKLAMMKDPHKAAVLSAIKRYQTVGGDINKLSTAHRTLVTNYLAKSGGLDNTTRSAAMAALKNQAAPKTDKM